MEITIKKDKIHNFISYEDDQINFNELGGLIRIKGKNFDNPGQVNGSGKSAMLLTIPYGLFGKLPYELKNENIGNMFLPNDKNTSVTLELTVSDKNYKIVSGLKGKQSYCELYAANDNGEYEDITKSSIAETRKFINKNILGDCDLDLFMRTTFLNSDKTYNFYNLKKADREEFFDKVFDTKIFGEMYQIIHTETNIANKNLSNSNIKLGLYQQNKEELEKEESIWKDDQKAKREIAQTNYNNSYSKLSQKEEELKKKNDKVIQKNTKKDSDFEAAIKLLNGKKDEYESEQNTLKSVICNLSSEITSLEIERDSYQKVIDQYSELKNKVCDDCKKIVSNHYNLDKIQHEIDLRNYKIQTKNKNKKNIEDKLKKIANNIELVSNKLTTAQSKREQLNTEYNKQQDKLNEYRNEINNLRSDVIKYQNELNNIDTAVNPYTSLILNKNNEISKETEINLSCKEQFLYKSKAQEIVDPKYLKKFIVHDLIDTLNDLIKFYLKQFGADYTVIFDEDLNYTFVNSAKTGIEFNNFSLGEQTRISIATCFAFRDLISIRSNITSNILILDEFFDSNVDTLARENAIKILRTMVENSNQIIYVVSNSDEISDELFDHIIQVEKRNNISKINVLR